MKSKKIKVLFILPSLTLSNGVASFAMNCYKKIDHQSFSIDFLINSDYGTYSGYRQLIEDNDDKIIILPDIHNPIRHLKECKTILNEGKYDVVHNSSLVLSLPIFYISKKENIKLRIFHSHSTKFSDKKFRAFRNSLFVPMIKKCANKNLACSEAAGKWMFGNKPFTVVHNGIDLGVFKFSAEKRIQMRLFLSLKSDAFVIGHVGRFAEVKNHRFIIDLFSELRKESDKYILLLVGDGELRNDIKAYAKEKSVFDSIIFTGNVNNVQDYMQAMDVFVLPSKFEGLGIVAVESQACGLPVVASENVPEEAKITENVRFVSTNDMTGWVETVKEMAHLPKHDNTESVRSAGYDIKQTAKELMEVYLHG